MTSRATLTGRTRRATAVGGVLAAVLAGVLSLSLAAPTQASPPTPAEETVPAGRDTAQAQASRVRSVAPYDALSRTQRRELMRIARHSWRFFRDDVDPHTFLPLDNLTYAGGSRTPTSRGGYTSSANIGVYLWSVVSAADLGLVSRGEATLLVRRTLRSVRGLQRSKGFLYQWYDTSTGDVITNPNEGACPQVGGTFDNCSQLSNVDNGWYASGLVVVRQALPGVARLASRLIKPMDFGIFYDRRAQTHCNTNPAIEGNQPTGQMFGVYFAGRSPYRGDNASHYYHNGALYSDPRISAYLGLGLHQMPGDVWWRTWRELPPPAPFADCAATDPDFSWQGQWPMRGKWVTIRDPQSHKAFPVWEGHYTYPGTKLRYMPVFTGGMFEGLMANNVVPETSWGTRGFGLADRRLAQVQMRYATQKLGYPVWGMSPSSTADDSGDYGIFGAGGLRFRYFGVGANAEHPNRRLAQCADCVEETTVTPHASFLALDVAPQRALENIMRLKRRYPGVYGSRGFFDAVNPTTGRVGHRILVLDQSMIMASIDNALRNRAMQRHFAADPISRESRHYLSVETMTLGR